MIHHLAIGEEWADVAASGRWYERSTIDSSLDEVGYIHCAFAHQVEGVVARYYPDRADVVVLTIDPSGLEAEVRIENTSGGSEVFPHLYGPLDPAAVVAVTPLQEFLTDPPG